MNKDGWKKLAVKSLAYILSETPDGLYVFEVYCGGVAVTDRSILLNLEEIDEYKSKGEVFLDRLERDLCRNYDKYKSRLILVS